MAEYKVLKACASARLRMSCAVHTCTSTPTAATTRKAVAAASAAIFHRRDTRANRGRSNGRIGLSA
ncbi:hypothetical protein NORO109296_24315 [Nocardiopsis rhodophaea]